MVETSQPMFTGEVEMFEAAVPPVEPDMLNLFFGVLHCLGTPYVAIA